jgi:hypothetical protein
MTVLNALLLAGAAGTIGWLMGYLQAWRPEN